MNPIVNKLKRITSFHTGPPGYSDLEVDASHLAMLKSRILNHATTVEASVGLETKPHDMIASALYGSAALKDLICVTAFFGLFFQHATPWDMPFLRLTLQNSSSISSSLLQEKNTND